MISIIIASRNEGILVKNTILSMISSKNKSKYEIVLVDDGSTDGSSDFLAEDFDNVLLIKTNGVGLGPARNLGVKFAKGTYLIFCDAHIEVEDFWLDKLQRVILDGADAVCPVIENLELETGSKWNLIEKSVYARKSNPRMLGKTMINSNTSIWLEPSKDVCETAILPGGCYMIKKDAFLNVGGYQKEFKNYGWDEEDISMKLWTNGYVLKASPFVTIKHFFRPAMPYHVKEKDIYYNLVYFAIFHYNEERLKNLLRRLEVIKTVSVIYETLINREDIIAKRNQNFSTRKYNDDWFMKKFGIA